MARILSLVFAGSFLILSVAHSTLPGEEKGRLQSLSRRCQDENHLKPEEVEDLRPMKRVETTDQRIKCFVKCMLTGLNLMSEGGDFTLDDLPQHLKKHQNHFQSCRNVTGTDFCDKALNFQNCAQEQRAHKHT